MLAFESATLPIAWFVGGLCVSFAIGAFVLRAVATRVETRALAFIDAFGYVAGSTILGLLLSLGLVLVVVWLDAPMPDWLGHLISELVIAALLYAFVRRLGRFAPRAALIATGAAVLAMYALGLLFGG
jgi:hypothetical protein